MNGRSRGATAKVFIASLILALALTGCSLKGPRKHWWEFWKPKQPQTASIYPSPESVPSPPPITEAGKPGEISSLPVQTPIEPSGSIPAATPPRHEPTAIAELPIIYFDFDSSAIRPDQIPALDQAVEWLKAHPDVQVQIEGHCDERGTKEYNLNLGQRRADAVREYLVSKGIDPNRLYTISYGEERPIDPGHNEAAWAQNRRVQFLVY